MYYKYLKRNMNASTWHFSNILSLLSISFFIYHVLVLLVFINYLICILKHFSIKLSNVKKGLGTT